MGIALGLILVAAGAILRWAVTDEVEGIDLGTAGVILVIAGVVALLWGLLASMTLPWQHDHARGEPRSRDRL